MFLISTTYLELDGFFFGSLEFVIDGVGGASAFAFASAGVFNIRCSISFGKKGRKSLGVGVEVAMGMPYPSIDQVDACGGSDHVPTAVR